MAKPDSSGCFGCLGTMFSLFLIGSAIFGGGFLMRFGGVTFGVGSNSNDHARDLTNLENQKNIADASVQKVHAQIDQGQCKALYDEGHEVLRKAQTLPQMERFCGLSKQRLGTVVSSELTDFWVHPVEQASDQYLLMRYQTKYSKELVREEFIWYVSDGKPQLATYTTAIITNESSKDTIKNPIDTTQPVLQ
jgi:hypothetical protein